MTDHIVDAFFEDQKDLAPEIRAKPDVPFDRGQLQAEFDVASSEDITCEATHTLSQIAELILFRIDGPDYVTHRVDQLARRTGDHLERFARRRIINAARLLYHFA